MIAPSPQNVAPLPVRGRGRGHSQRPGGACDGRGRGQGAPQPPHRRARPRPTAVPAGLGRDMGRRLLLCQSEDTIQSLICQSEDNILTFGWVKHSRLLEPMALGEKAEDKIQSLMLC